MIKMSNFVLKNHHKYTKYIADEYVTHIFKWEIWQDTFIMKAAPNYDAY